MALFFLKTVTLTGRARRAPPADRRSAHVGGRAKDTVPADAPAAYARSGSVRLLAPERSANKSRNTRNRCNWARLARHEGPGELAIRVVIFKRS